MKKTLNWASLYIMLNFCACSYHTQEVSPCSEDLGRNIYYSLDVSPIVGKTCAIPSCHVTGFEKGDFTRFDEIKKSVDNETFEFMIITAQMPHGNTKGPKILTDCEIEIIRKWIREGAVNN